MPSPSCLYISPFWTLIPAALNRCLGKIETHAWVFQKVMVLRLCQTGSLGRISNVDSSRCYLMVFRSKAWTSSFPQAPPFPGIGCEGQNLSGLQLRRQSWFYSLLLYFLLGRVFIFTLRAAPAGWARGSLKPTAETSTRNGDGEEALFLQISIKEGSQK